MISRFKKIKKTYFDKNTDTNQKEGGSSECGDRDIFFANMSHEVRTPVNGIVGFTQLLKDTELTDEQDELVNTIHASSMHLLEIINDILDFSKINANKMESENITFDIFRQIEDAVEIYAAVASEKEVELRVYTDPSIPSMLMGDPSKLSQIIINLVNNAVKFTDLFGVVDVSVDKIFENQQHIDLRFSIKDSGIGIKEENRKKIFDAFSQADSAISRKFGGTGLGLAISSKLVDLMGGTLELECTKDIGSEFYFILRFEKSKAKDRKIYSKKYTGFSAGFVLDHIDINGKVYENIGKYIEYLGVDFKVYTSSQIFEMSETQLPDMLFVDHKHSCSNGDIEDLLDIKSKIILITTAGKRKKHNIDSSMACRIINKPINLTKAIKSFEVCIDSINSAYKSNETKLFSGVSVLVAEDNPVNQKLLERILKNMDMKVQLVDNGKEAVSLVVQNRYDIIFMDIQMPVMDGIEATAEIIELQKSVGEKKTPIIALTGNASEKDNMRCIDAGMDGYIFKPIDVNVLISYIRKYTVSKSILKTINRNEEKRNQIFSGAKALVIEDNSINRNLLERTLSSMDMDVVTARSSSKAIKLHEEIEFDIVFMSMQIPTAGGIELANSFLQYEEDNFLDHTPIIALLREDETEYGIYDQVSIDSYIHRPLDIDEVKLQVDRYIKKKEYASKRDTSRVQQDTIEGSDSLSLEAPSISLSAIIEEIKADDYTSKLKDKIQNTKNNIVHAEEKIDLDSEQYLDSLQEEIALEKARQEAEQARKEAEEAEQARKEAEEAEKARQEAEEAEQARKEAEEAEKARQEAEQARKEAEEAEKARQEAEQARKEAEEAEKARQEAEQARKEAEEAEQARKEAEEAEQARKEAEEAEKARQEAEEAEQARKEAEEAEKARQEAEEAEQARKEAEEAEKARQEAEQARKEAEEAEKARQEAEQARKEAEEAEKARQEAEQARKEAEEAEQARKEAEEAEQARKEAEEAEKARQEAEEAEQARKEAEEAEKAKQEAEEAVGTKSEKPNSADAVKRIIENSHHEIKYIDIPL